MPTLCLPDRSQPDQKCDYKGIINEICLDTPTLIAKGMIMSGNEILEAYQYL